MAARATPAAKRLYYAASTEADGRMLAEGEDPLDPSARWTPEHLLLAALCRCTLTSLRYHAKRRSLAVGGRGAATGVVTRREEDGRYALVEAACDLAVRIDPEPESDAIAELILKAERDCFVGASLAVRPSYRWEVNGRAFD